MTEQQILEYLDRCNFPMLDNGYYYHADQQLKIYRDANRWLLVLQLIQYNNHRLDLSGFSTTVYKYGSDIEAKQTFRNVELHNFASDDDVPTFIEEINTFNSYLNKEAKQIRINNALIPIQHNHDKYKEKGITLESLEKIRPWEILRYITPEYSNNFWIKRDDLNIDSNLEEEITLRNWEHPDNYETGPSDMNSFKEIARCLANDLKFDRARFEANNSNTHWSNWPEGGNL